MCSERFSSNFNMFCMKMFSGKSLKRRIQDCIFYKTLILTIYKFHTRNQSSSCFKINVSFVVLDTWYLAKSGNDTDCGKNIKQPCRSIAKTLSLIHI